MMTREMADGMISKRDDESTNRQPAAKAIVLQINYPELHFNHGSQTNTQDIHALQ